MRYADSPSSMSDANAGHDFDELDKRLAEIEAAGRRLHEASERLHDAGYGLNYTQDRMGADTKLVVKSYVDNQIAESDEFIEQAAKLISGARAAQRLQSGADEQVGDALANAVPAE